MKKKKKEVLHERYKKWLDVADVQFPKVEAIEGKLLSVKSDGMIQNRIKEIQLKKETLYDYCSKRNMFL